jgi:hypothetical protein
MSNIVRYKAVAPAKDKEGKLCYNEKTLGVQFTKGVAIFDDVTLQSDGLGRKAKEIAFSMEKDFGYKITRMDAEGKPLTREQATAMEAESVEVPDQEEDPELEFSLPEEEA